jgi:rare lipoprotein A
MLLRPPGVGRILAALVALALLTGCSHGPKPTASSPEPQHRDSTVPPDLGVDRDHSHDRDEDEHDRDEPRRAHSGKAYEQRGMASYYAKKFEGRRTANGERYRGAEMTAAHKTLPFGTKIRVTNLSNGKSVDVVVNDRGPHKKGRIVDLSRCAAEEIGLIAKGVTKVLLEVIDPVATESAARE